MVEEENLWVFDSLVCFLNGPIWDAPIQSFIEEKSLIFEMNTDGESEEDYKAIFEEYKNLVDVMLGNFMEDIGITPEQFEYACNKGNEHRNSLRFDHTIFEQIWAANDYEMFKRMMTQKNVELQLQALELIERKYGIMPKSFVPKNKEAEAHSAIVERIPEQNIEKVVLEAVADKFSVEEECPEIEVILEEKEILENSIEQLKFSETITTSNNENVKTPKNVDIEEVKATETVLKEPKKIDQAELKKRQEYLRAQRDKLVALKKEERRVQFSKTTDENVVKNREKLRPKSAKAAQAILTGHDVIVPQQSQEFQLRKTLAERLKIEVVNKFKN